MRRPLVFVLIAVIVLLAGTTTFLFMRHSRTSADFADLKAAEEAARARYAETIQAVAEIQDSLNAISVGDTNVQMSPGDLHTEQKLRGPSGREALDRIAELRASIQRNKERIRKLESDLRHSGVRIRGLERMVANLKRTVLEKEALVAQLAGQVDSLQTHVTELVAEVQQTEEKARVQEQVIEDKRRELATIYYVIGTRRELMASGIVEATGGILGLGRTLQPTGHFMETSFTPLDTDEETVVQIPSAKVRVLSAQPPSSYELRPLEGRTELHIVDPAEFRKVKQVVILAA